MSISAGVSLQMRKHQDPAGLSMMRPSHWRYRTGTGGQPADVGAIVLNRSYCTTEIAYRTTLLSYYRTKRSQPRCPSALSHKLRARDISYFMEAISSQARNIPGSKNVKADHMILALRLESVLLVHASADETFSK